MKKHLKYFAVLLITVFAVSCDSNDDNSRNDNSSNDSSEYISYKIDGGETVFANDISWAGPIPINEGGLGTELWVVGNLANGGIIKISGDVCAPGVYTTATHHFGIDGPFGGVYAVGGDTPANTMSFNLTNHGNLGEYIDMTFSGTYTNQTGTHTLNGTVHVIRNH
ncbi:hypothetical protein FEDK69T_25680 [Flavobacterium enshiense DK69]|uniref:Lipoprotein n=1 Tax=Flavobacterium enshiense DK69 TaxID=1107311 RepID=V6S3H3_9FLAO|nr:hypothetical protein [Flavobacterium enshiense]ESU21201.1 hypothetical protein FEDK69T_25680 [Flavobacterium enshiense DK69]KGO93488.1 hypothetical protein Q767_14705 [Flavobacterium enshiense DK69]